MRLLVTKTSVFLALLFCPGILTASAENLIAIKAGRLLDGTGAPATENTVPTSRRKSLKLRLTKLIARE